MSVLGRIFRLWRPRAFALALGIGVSLAAVTVGLALMTRAGALVAGATALGMFRGIGAGRVLLRYLERLTTHSATFKALADLRVWFFRRLTQSAAGGLGHRHAGDVLARLVGDISALDGLYLRIIVPLAGAVLLLPAVALAGAVLGIWPAIGVTMLFVLAAFMLPLAAARASLAEGSTLAQASAALRVATLDALTGLREVRAFGAEGRMLAGMQAREAKLLRAQHVLARRGAWVSALAFLCGQGAIVILLLAAVITVPARSQTLEWWHSLTSVLAVAAVFLVATAFEAAGALPRAGLLSGHITAAATRVLAAADLPPPVPEPAHPAPLTAVTALRFENIHFSWAENRVPVFNGLTIDIPAGLRVAVLGPSGIGKSTLAALALKLAAPQRGRVLLGGTDIATLAADDVRRRIAWLSQQTHLFDDSIRNNLLLGRPDADDAALWAALDAARIGDMVRALPGGLDAYAGESGALFSGGQGRRLALARTLLSPAPILILDEPAAGLDAATERAFHETLGATTAGRTVVLITHRLLGVEQIDRIYRLSAGHALAAAG